MFMLFMSDLRNNDIEKLQRKQLRISHGEIVAKIEVNFIDPQLKAEIGAFTH